MITDWAVIARLARELDRALSGGRISDVGLLDDGRLGVRVAARGDRVLAVDPFGTPPTAVLEETQLALGGDPGYARAIGTALRGMRIEAVRARPGDRVIAIDAGSLSRFGVGSRASLVLELVPRFGNVVLVRDRIVVAAAKQFAPAENAARSVQIGFPYEPPPLAAPSLDRAGFVETVRAGKPALRALSTYRPQLPRAVAESVVAEVESGRSDARDRGEALADAADAALVELERAIASDDPIYVYRRDGRTVAAHVVPLAQFGGAAAAERAPTLLPILRASIEESRRRGGDDAVERRRRALRTRIERRLAAIAEQLAELERRLADVAERDRLRESGDLLHTYATLVPAGAASFTAPDQDGFAIPLDPELDPKANAAAYFARYRKATDALPHLERRRAALTSARASLEELAWSLEGGDGAVVAEIAAEFERLEGRAAPARAQAPAKRRAITRVDRPSGARIFVGRSPRENAEVTFRIARPDDLWFHARAVPGSHVVLQPPPGGEPDASDLQAAADLAAEHSRAHASGRVTIDYTARKYVRKQRDAAEGLVWYTNARSITGFAH